MATAAAARESVFGRGPGRESAKAAAMRQGFDADQPISGVGLSTRERQRFRKQGFDVSTPRAQREPTEKQQRAYAQEQAREELGLTRSEAKKLAAPAAPAGQAAVMTSSRKIGSGGGFWAAVTLGVLIIGYAILTGHWSPGVGIGVLILLFLAAIYPPIAIGFLAVVGFYLLLTHGSVFFQNIAGLVGAPAGAPAGSGPSAISGHRDSPGHGQLP